MPSVCLSSECLQLVAVASEHVSVLHVVCPEWARTVWPSADGDPKRTPKRDVPRDHDDSPNLRTHAVSQQHAHRRCAPVVGTGLAMGCPDHATSSPGCETGLSSGKTEGLQHLGAVKLQHKWQDMCTFDNHLSFHATSE